MATTPTRFPAFARGLVLGLAVGGLCGGIAGYVINDLTSRENPEVAADIQEQQQVQQNLDDFLQQLPPPAEGSGH
ncbi:MAG: hypothetical protein H6700_05420 [Myxococcales bacterium]|nr:hypothetical protein [Myxococcales bacterium]